MHSDFVDRLPLVNRENLFESGEFALLRFIQLDDAFCRQRIQDSALHLDTDRDGPGFLQLQNEGAGRRSEKARHNHLGATLSRDMGCEQDGDRPANQRSAASREVYTGRWPGREILSNIEAHAHNVCSKPRASPLEEESS